jgi:hypothetical protein
LTFDPFLHLGHDKNNTGLVVLVVVGVGTDCADFGDSPRLCLLLELEPVVLVRALELPLIIIVELKLRGGTAVAAFER